MMAKMTSKGQITIPKAIRERLGLKPGSILDFDEKGPGLIARRVIDRKAAYAVIGCAKDKMKGITLNQWLNETRGPVELPPAHGRRRR